MKPHRCGCVEAAARPPLNGLAPGFTSDLLGWANRLVLPAAADGQEIARGMEFRQRARSSVLGAVTRLGFSAAERYNQYPGFTGRPS